MFAITFLGGVVSGRNSLFFISIIITVLLLQNGDTVMVLRMDTTMKRYRLISDLFFSKDEAKVEGSLPAFGL